jgi:hypothetical protein
VQVHLGPAGLLWGSFFRITVLTWQNDDWGLGQGLRRADQHQRQEQQYVHVVHGDENANARAGATNALRTQELLSGDTADKRSRDLRLFTYEGLLSAAADAEVHCISICSLERCPYS